jgi:ABC-type antimicrobial peptide transport system permease subunit
MGHLSSERMHSYIYKKSNFDRALNKIFEHIGLDAKLQSETPILTNMEAQNVIEFMLNNVLATVIFFICLLSFILIFSLMQTDVEERKYEFAVLRTLGLRNRSLITLITIQSLIFSIPGIIGGFIVMLGLSTIAQFAL